MGTPTKNYGLPQWDGNEYFKRTAMNEGFTKVDEALKKVEDGAGAVVEEALKSFDRLSMQTGNKTTDTLSTADNLDTWTSVISDAGGHEVARKVDKEGKQPDGKAMWTTTITIGDKTVTVTDKETDNGWTREVK
jgi:hypothetical protein